MFIKSVGSRDNSPIIISAVTAAVAITTVLIELRTYLANMSSVSVIGVVTTVARLMGLLMLNWPYSYSIWFTTMDYMNRWNWNRS